MIYTRLGIIALTILSALLVVKLCRSKKFDTWCNNLFTGKLKDSSFSIKNTIKDITQSEKNLSKQADINKKEAVNLQKDSGKIEEYLDKRGVHKKEGSV